MGEWPKVRLGDICTKIGSGATPRGGKETYLARRDRYALIRSQNVFDRRFDDEGLAFITDAQAVDLRSATVQPGDVLLNITGDGVTFGRCCRVPDRVLPACANQHVAIIRTNRDLADPGWVLTVLADARTKAYIESFNAGGSRRAITKGNIESFKVPLPPLSEQRRIAGILGALDDKIELNRRTSETLEAMVRAIFRSWFVDFEPVRAKAEGRHPGLPPHLADLFPNRLVDSDLGQIPAGWAVGTMGDVATNSRRGALPNEMTPGTPYIALEHMPRGSIGLSDWSVSDRVASGKHRFEAGEILFGKLRPYFYKVGVAPVAGVCSTDIVVITPSDPAWSAFVLGHASSAEFVEFTNAGSTGTKMPRTSWAEMARYRLAVPTLSLAAQLDNTVKPAIDRIVGAIHENRSLAAVRDALLPRLLTGELEVPA